jgi:NADH-quinone oxidoreductase subunit K
LRKNASPEAFPAHAAATMIPIQYYLLLSAALFVTGVAGVLIRRNAIIIFMCIELMLNAVNLSFVAFSAQMGESTGQIMVFFVMAVAAAEAATGLAIIIALFRNRQTVDVTQVSLLKW